MPKIFMYGRYVIFVWSNESGEPIHVHVSQGSPSKSSVKIWILSDGTLEVQKNPDLRIVPAKDLRDICKQISKYTEKIRNIWFSINGSIKYKDSEVSIKDKTSLFS